MKKITLILLILFCVAAVIAQDGKQNVAVYMAGKEPVGAKGAHKILGSELAKAITNSDTYSAVDRTDAVLKQIEQEHSYQRSGAVSDEQIKALGKQFGVSYLCIAEISEVKGGAYFLEARLVDVEKATVLKIASVNSSLKDNKEMVSAAQRVARDLIIGKKEPAAHSQIPTPGITSGQIVITSTPNGAAVKVNGKQIGATPLTFTPESTGSMAITVSMPGYEPSAKTIGYGGGTVSMPFILKKVK